LGVPGFAFGCSVDPTTRNLAVTYDASSGGRVAVFANARGKPTTYNPSLYGASFCGYDSDGDLFVDGFSESIPFVLTELAQGRKDFQTLDVKPAIHRLPGQVQWDGDYITVEGTLPQSDPEIYRLTVSGSRATIVGTTKISGVALGGSQSWIQGSTLLVPFGSRNKHGIQGKAATIGLWMYPAGGSPLRLVKHFGDKHAFPNGVTVSVPKSD
jgi:hypothetical protein